MERNKGLLAELWGFLKIRKKWWLLPTIILLVVAAAFIMFAASNSTLSPFIYALG